MSDFHSVLNLFEEGDPAEIWEDGVVYVDTSALLNLYEVSSSVRDDAIAVFESLGDRFRVPRIVQLEFAKQRRDSLEGTIEGIQGIGEELEDFVDGKISSQNSARSLTVDTSFGKFTGGSQKAISRRYGEKLKEKKDDFFHKAETELNNKLNAIESGASKEFEGFRKDLQKEEEKLREMNKNPNKDPVLQFLDGLESRSFLELPKEKNFKKWKSEAEERFDKNIPPGTNDEEKNRRFINKHYDFEWCYNDALIWKEILVDVGEEGAALPGAILITNDDKGWKNSNKKARRELTFEMVSDTRAESLVLHSFRGAIETAIENQVHFKSKDPSDKTLEFVDKPVGAETATIKEDGVDFDMYYPSFPKRRKMTQIEMVENIVRNRLSKEQKYKEQMPAPGTRQQLFLDKDNNPEILIRSVELDIPLTEDKTRSIIQNTVSNLSRRNFSKVNIVFFGPKGVVLNSRLQVGDLPTNVGVTAMGFEFPERGENTDITVQSAIGWSPFKKNERIRFKEWPTSHS